MVRIIFFVAPFVRVEIWVLILNKSSILGSVKNGKICDVSNGFWLWF